MRVAALIALCFAMPVVAAASTAKLPAQGIVSATKGGVALVDLHGHVVRRLDGFRLDERYGPYPPREVLLRKAGREYAVGARGLRRAQRPRADWPLTKTGCHPAPLPYVICGGPYARGRRTVSRVVLENRVLVRSANAKYPLIGHWVSAQLAPDGKTLLLQWSAECEIPVAYFANADGSHLRVVAPAANSRNGPLVTTALGWARDGRAVVANLETPCGGRPRQGIYLIDPKTRARTFVTPRLGRMWGSAFRTGLP